MWKFRNNVCRQFADLKCVILKSRISQFWRHQKKSPRWYLATIEAIHQFLVELHTCAFGAAEGYADRENSDASLIKEKDHLENGLYQSTNKSSAMEQEYRGQYDDLLYFFKYMYEKIHAMYDHDKLRACKRPLL